MKIYYFDITPVAKPRETQSDRWNKRRPVMKYLAYKQELNLKANVQRFRLAEHFIITFFLQTPLTKRWQTPHQQKPDLDNLVKAFMDALTNSDQGVWSFTASKIWSEKPGIKVMQDN